MRMRNPQMRVVRNPDAQQPPPEPPIPWKLIAITTAISGVVGYAVSRALTGVENKLLPQSQNPNPALPQPQPVYIVDASTVQMPRAMGGNEAVPPAAANPATRTGLTESDLQIWANELSQREGQLDQRAAFIEQESRRLRLVR